MDKDRFSDGVFFKWLNQKEIYKKYDNKGRSRRIQAYLQGGCLQPSELLLQQG